MAKLSSCLTDAGVGVLTTARSVPSNVPNGVIFETADVSTAVGCNKVASAVQRHFGSVDIVVHVVGGSSAPAGGFAVLDDEEWQRALDQI